MTKEELLQALLVERYTSPWWVTPTPELVEDDDVTIRRRQETATQEQKAFETSNKTRPRKVA